MSRVFVSSSARITDLQPRVWGTVPLGEMLDLEPVPRARWAMGDYVIARVLGGHDRPTFPLELPSGRMVELVEGDLVLGVLGKRRATLEIVGDWEAIGDDLRMDLLTGAGLIGRITSQSMLTCEAATLRYEGHARAEGRLLRMDDLVPPAPDVAFCLPTVLVIGSSMSAGKTTAARRIIRILRESGRKIVAAKLTGAARYRDVLTMGDAGASWILDFVDAGLPSTVCDPERYRRALRWLLARAAAEPADVAVFEAGASPLEPYNGAVAVEMTAPHVRCTVLCASDPYSAIGIAQAFERQPDLVTGITAGNDAGKALVEQLTGLPALDVRDPAASPALGALLARCLGRD